MVITGNEFDFKYQIAFLTENLWSLSPKSQFSNLPRSLFADFTPFWPISLTSLRLSLKLRHFAIRLLQCNILRHLRRRKIKYLECI